MENNQFRIDPESITWACLDPSWEYAEIWYQLYKIRQELDVALVDMSRLGAVNIVTDTDFSFRTKQLIARLESVSKMLAP